MKCAFDAVVEPSSGGGAVLKVSGSVIVSSPDVVATFGERVPQGMDPDVLLMNLVLDAGSGRHAPEPTERLLAFAKAYPAGAHVPARVEVHTTSGEAFGCAVAGGH